jgi:single-stranded DNA-binding protein
METIMASLNKVLLMGNMTRDPQLSYLPSQTSGGIRPAMTRKFKTGRLMGRKLLCGLPDFGKRAEVINKYFKKATDFHRRPAEIRFWQAQDGTKRSELRFCRILSLSAVAKAVSPPDNQESPRKWGADAPHGTGGGDEIPF